MPLNGSRAPLLERQAISPFHCRTRGGRMDILGHPAERYMLGHCVQPSTGPGHGTQCGPKPCSRRLRRRRMQAHRRGRRVVAPCRMRRRPPPGRWTLCRSRRPSAACSSAPSSISTRRTRARPPPSGSVAPAEARPGFMRATFARLIAGIGQRPAPRTLLGTPAGAPRAPPVQGGVPDGPAAGL